MTEQILTKPCPECQGYKILVDAGKGCKVCSGTGRVDLDSWEIHYRTARKLGLADDDDAIRDFCLDHLFPAMETRDFEWGAASAEKWIFWKGDMLNQKFDVVGMHDNPYAAALLALSRADDCGILARGRKGDKCVYIERSRL